MRRTRIIKRVLLTVISALAALMVVCNQLVVKNAERRLFDKVDSVPEREYVGLLLGTTPITRISHKRNMFFENRIKATANLYHAGKIQKVLISGDDHSLDGINETECMKDSLLARGVPENDIILDGKGYRTIHSVQRAYHDFGCRNLIVISQKFHNERALYLANHLGLDFDQVIGFNAESPRSLMSQKTYVREWFARVKMFMDLLSNNHQELHDSKRKTEPHTPHAGASAGKYEGEILVHSS